MINMESLIKEIRAALDRDPGADDTIIKTATLMVILDLFTNSPGVQPEEPDANTNTTR